MEKFTFFYGGPFSNWYSTTIKINNETYNCSEQYMMAEKARLFGDNNALKSIMSTSDPSKQKRCGRQVKNFNKEKWEKQAQEIVFKGCYAKFTQNESLKKELIETAGTTLVEASPFDKIWGIGLSKDDPRANNRNTWLGTNWLGEILTRVREKIMIEEKEKTYEHTY